MFQHDARHSEIGYKHKLVAFIKPFFVLLVSLGLDIRSIAALRYLPRYISQYAQFKKLGGSVTHKFPVLKDYAAQAGAARGHYFHQDLLVASLIYQANPVRHIDVGSRIDGFVAHVASFRKIEVMDVRDLCDTGHSNISFLKADLMNALKVSEGIADSISCLHAIEHFGLGRYGDPLNPNGHIQGFNNLLRMLKQGGILYISFPIGRSNEVHFNAHRVFGCDEIFSWADMADQMELLRFDYVDDDGNLHKNIDLNKTKLDVKYGCGIYTFKKH